MQKMIKMLRQANIKFEWDIFTNSKIKSDYEEIRILKSRFDIWDYLASADYTVLLSDCEGLPYTVQESLQYDTPCIVTDIGGCTELINHGVNGYVVPLNMEFDINIIKNIPKISNYKGTTAQDWCDLLGGAEYIEKEMDTMSKMVKVEVLRKYYDTEFKRDLEKGEIITIERDRAMNIIKASSNSPKGAVLSIINDIIEKAVKEEVVEKAKPIRRRNAKK